MGAIYSPAARRRIDRSVKFTETLSKLPRAVRRAWPLEEGGDSFVQQYIYLGTASSPASQRYNMQANENYYSAVLATPNGMNAADLTEPDWSYSAGQVWAYNANGGIDHVLTQKHYRANRVGTFDPDPGGGGSDPRELYLFWPDKQAWSGRSVNSGVGLGALQELPLRTPFEGIEIDNSVNKIPGWQQPSGITRPIFKCTRPGPYRWTIEVGVAMQDATNISGTILLRLTNFVGWTGLDGNATNSNERAITLYRNAVSGESNVRGFIHWTFYQEFNLDDQFTIEIAVSPIAQSDTTDGGFVYVENL